MVSGSPDSYWVKPDVLMAGEYPGAQHEDEVRPRLEALRTAGIRSFLDLTEEHELVPYQAQAAELGLVWRRLPILDVSIPTRDRMAEILAHIEAEEAARRPVYVHCWGGVGRTGTVVGCWLREKGLSGDDALDTIATLRSETSKAWRESPETDEQRAFIEAW